MRHPVAVLIPTLLFLLVLGSPFLHVRFNAPDATILPPEVPSRAAFDRLQAEFGEGEFAPIVLAIRTDGAATSPANLAALYDYSRRLARDPRVAHVDSLVDVDRRLTLAQYTLLYGDPNGPRDRYIQTGLAATTKGDLTAFTVYTPFGPNRDEGRALVADLRRPGSALAPPAGMTVLVGGGAADVADVVDRVRADFPRTALFIIVSTYLVLFVLLRSVVLPAKALVMNTLSIVASFGALVWIFQDGNLSGPLGFQPLGFVETTQPVILFCVLFGLSMDYEVFLLTRMKEVWDRTGDNVEAVAGGMERSGRIVTSAALIVVLVAGSFAFADIVLIKALGVGHGDRGRPRRDGHPGAAGAGHDATPRAAGTGGCRPPWNGSSRAGCPRRTPRSRPRSDDRSPSWAGRPPARRAAHRDPGRLCGGCGRCPDPGQPDRSRDRPPRHRAPRPSRSPTRSRSSCPRDDGPHDRLTEWWYYTGHLRAADGARYGFEYVIFRAERGQFPTSWASHLAITDEGGDRFLYGQRLEIGQGVDRSPACRRRPADGLRLLAQRRGPVEPDDRRASGLGDVRLGRAGSPRRPPSRPTRPRWRGRPAGSAWTCD